MVRSLVGALALASLSIPIPAALAFRNTSPFFLFSTAELLIPGVDGDIAELSQVTGRIKAALESCPTKTYIIVQQDGVSSADYLDRHAAPRLSHYLSGKSDKVRSTMAVPEVIGSASTRGKMATSAQVLADYLETHCGAAHLESIDGSLPAGASKISTIVGKSPSAEQGLLRADAELEDRIVDLAGSDDFTVIYTTTPPTEPSTSAAQGNKPTYEMENPFAGAVQMELKRDLSSHKRAAQSKEGGLFERYQYFSPGIFMALIAIVPMFSIIFVGLKALTSLEVSYFAFSKEMGPAQRKQ